MDLHLALTRFGDRSLWDEDVAWLAGNLATCTVGDLAGRTRWLHLYLDRVLGSDGVLARILADIAGQDLANVCAIRAGPQAALCAAFTQVACELEREVVLAG